jgi:predicted transcriptional regulator
MEEIPSLIGLTYRQMMAKENQDMIRDYLLRFLAENELSLAVMADKSGMDKQIIYNFIRGKKATFVNLNKYVNWMREYSRG